ncbi:hypothetical protein CRYUN_Cryun40dG0091600 [Craigia yunnanensis]
MVSAQLVGLTKGRTYKPFDAQLLFPPLEAVVPHQVELDFSDVFGPLPVRASIEVNCGELDSTVSAVGASELVYDEPDIVYSRSHSLLCPSSCVSQSLKLSKLTLRETGDSVDIVECVKEETINEVEEHSFGDGDDKKSLEDVNGDHLEAGTIGIEDFEILKVVGQGAFGKVYQVRKTGTPEIYAMKVMRKDKIMEKNHAEYMKAERDILTKVDHPFIVQLKYSFQTKYRLHLVLDFINGGHLFFQLYHHGLFREDLARIYTAEIVSAVSHLHANGIMHRDLKPENILLDADGHVKLTDFGLAKQFNENTRSNSLCGTVEYMPPEIIIGKGHDKAVDWWSVGILLYEMLTGKLLNKEASKRLGSGPTGSEEIKRHKWFKPINWKKLEAREIQPCFRPEVAGKNCIANFDKRLTDMTLSFSPASSPKTNVNPFTDFTYIRPVTHTVI